MATSPTSGNPDDSIYSNYYDANDDIPMGSPVNAPNRPMQASGDIRQQTRKPRDPRRIGSQSHHRSPQDGVSHDEDQTYTETSDGTTEEDDELDAMIESSEAGFIVC